MIVQALEMTRGNQSLAAEHLGMPRRTLLPQAEPLPDNAGTPPFFAQKLLHCLAVYHRTELNVPVGMTSNTGSTFIAAEARNLSLGGLGLQDVQPPLQAAEELTISFTLPGVGQRIEVQGVVVWSQPNGMAGIKFSGISDSTAALLQSWIASNRQLPPADAVELSAA